jgi:S1-C subfamily serine protease
MPSLSPAPVRAPAPAAGQEAGEDDTFLQSVVVVHATIVEVDFASPWHKEKPDRSRGSGFIIADPRAPERGRLILTNAHVVDYSTEVFVQRYQSDDRVRARILRLVTDCDVAILVVEDDEFWDGEDGVRLPPLTFGVMPKIQDVVRVGKFVLIVACLMANDPS